ncbi:MAG: c-type cytochrome [Thiogranum sp.]|jgi:cytochrome c5|nr:c-type cytochrome [Thiogranum sp.]
MKSAWMIITLALLLAVCGDRNSALQAAALDGASGSAQPGEGAPNNETPLTAARENGSQVSPDEPAAPVYDLQLGEAVFTNTCLACHGKGVYHAPVFGNGADWEPRLKQDLNTLIGHAINGHRGMPPKGGFFLLSDEEVAAAVAYAVDRSQEILLAMKRKKRSEACDPVKNLEKCSKPELEEVLTLQMLWLLGGGGN